MVWVKTQKGYLDALKGIAIIAVTLIHVGGADLPGIVGVIGREGARGVQMFFVVSAMLAFSSLERIFPTRKDMNLKRIGIWLLSKYFRLFPMFYLAMIISMLTGSWSGYWLGNEGHVTGKNIITHILFLHGFFPHYTDSVLGVEWYLGVLVIFYVVTPIIFYYIDSLEKSIVLLIGVQIVIPWINNKIAVFFPLSTDRYIYDTFIGTFGPLANMYVYCLGIVVYFILKKLDACKIEVNKRKILSYSLLIFCLMMLWGQINGNNSLYHLSYYDMFGIWFCIIIISQSIHSCIIIDNPFFRLCGKYSYGMYLLQFIWIRFYNKYMHLNWGNPILTKFVISVLGLLGLSYAMIRFIDTPIQKKLKQLISK